MSDKPFDEPQRVAINRVYTRRGDEGTTSLVGGQKVPKHAARIEAYGTVDELGALVGIARTSVDAASADHSDLARLSGALLRVQHQLFNLGAILATLPDDVHPRQPRVRQSDVDWLETEMDRANEHLPALRSFVLAGGSRLDAELHLCRTVCRRAERHATHLATAEPVDAESLAYLNRLSDAFFVWARHAAHVTGAGETLWEPNRADGGGDDDADG